MSRRLSRNATVARRINASSAKIDAAMTHWRMSFAGLPKQKAAGPGRGEAALEITKQRVKLNTSVDKT